MPALAKVRRRGCYNMLTSMPDVTEGTQAQLSRSHSSLAAWQTPPIPCCLTSWGRLVGVGGKWSPLPWSPPTPSHAVGLPSWGEPLPWEKRGFHLPTWLGWLHSPAPFESLPWTHREEGEELGPATWRMPPRLPSMCCQSPVPAAAKKMCSAAQGVCARQQDLILPSTEPAWPGGMPPSTKSPTVGKTLAWGGRDEGRGA